MSKKQIENDLNAVKKQMRSVIDNVTPKILYDYLNRHVIGQDEAKKYLSVAVYNHYKRFMDSVYSYGDNISNNPYKDVTIEKSNVILLGPSGSGKTYMLKMLADYLHIPFYIADSSSLTEAGYVGDDVENCILGALRNSNYNIISTQYSIIVLDEFDKLTRKSENTSITRDVGGEGVQQSLLKLVEGTTVSVPPNGGRKHPEQECIQIDTSNILFVGLGAFDGIEDIIKKRKNTKKIGFNTSNFNTQTDKEDILSQVTTSDLKKYGFIPELIGRFPVITHTKQLTEKDLINILTEPQNAIVKQYQKLLWLDNINLSFENEALIEIAKIAIEMKTGARGLRGVMDNILTNVMFEYGGYHKKKVNLQITKEMIDNYKLKNKIIPQIEEAA